MQSARIRHGRIELIDFARGTALVAMAVYHFTWDLDFFGYIEPGTSVTGGWRIFARMIASSFLVLVGFSLYLAHGQGIRLKPFLRRLGVIVAAAAGITIVTYFATPDAFIFFGILHHIAVATVLGLAVLRLPIALIVALAVAVALGPRYLHAPFLDQPAFWWTGLSRNVPGSNDYIPIFPWFAAVLFGISGAKLAERTGLLAWMQRLQPQRTVPLISSAGRHSLAFYLLHQPVLVSLVWLFALVIPPPPPDYEATFVRGCTSECARDSEEAFCRAYCTCILDGFSDKGGIAVLYATPRSEETQTRLEDVAFRCLVEDNRPGPETGGNGD